MLLYNMSELFIVTIKDLGNSTVNLQIALEKKAYNENDITNHVLSARCMSEMSTKIF